jgi:hypothetical protein
LFQLNPRLEYTNDRRVHLAATYSFLPTTRIRVEYETGRIHQVVASNSPISDAVSNWERAGKPGRVGRLTTAERD